MHALNNSACQHVHSMHVRNDTTTTPGKPHPASLAPPPTNRSIRFHIFQYSCCIEAPNCVRVLCVLCVCCVDVCHERMMSHGVQAMGSRAHQVQHHSTHHNPRPLHPVVTVQAHPSQVRACSLCQSLPAQAQRAGLDGGLDGELRPQPQPHPRLDGRGDATAWFFKQAHNVHHCKSPENGG